MKVNPGDCVAIDGVVYKFSPAAVRTYEYFIELFKKGEKNLCIYLFPENQYGKKDVSIPIVKIKEALERAECNKTAHGL